MEQSARHDILAVLEAGQDLTLATLREDGGPQATTVSYVSDGLSIYFGCSTSSQKARNLTRDPRVSATINLPYRSWDEIRGLSLGGTATRLAAPAELAFVGRLFVAKFANIANAFVIPAEDLALFCVTPLVISLLDYRKGFGHTRLLKAAELEARGT